MVSSRLFELLAEAEARPSGAFQDLQAATGAGTSIINAVKTGQENRLGKAKLADLFGADSEVAKRFPNVRLKDLERKGLSELMTADLANAPADLLMPELNAETGLPTGGTMKLGTFSKRSKVLPAPSINIFKSRELTLAEQKAAEERRQNEIRTRENQIDAANKRLNTISVHGMTMPGMEKEAADLSEKINTWNAEIERFGGKSKKLTVPAATQTTPVPQQVNPIATTPARPPAAPARSAAPMTQPGATQYRVGQSFSNPQTGEVATWDGKSWVISPKKQ